MKSRFIFLFILIISLKANSYWPLLLAQKHLDNSTEKLIVQIDSVTRKSVSPDITSRNPSELDFYRVELSAKIQFIGQTHSELREGYTIHLSYGTSEHKPNIPNDLCGYMPMLTPKEQDSCIVYLNKEGENYTFNEIGSFWSLQIITDEYKNDCLSSDSTPDWVKSRLNKITGTTVDQQVEVNPQKQGNNTYKKPLIFAAVVVVSAIIGATTYSLKK